MSKWARGSRKTAALLAAWTVTPGNSALSAVGDRREALELLVEERRSRVRRRWRSGSRRPASSRSGSSAQARASASTAAGSRLPSRPMPLSCLTWTRTGRPWARPRALSSSAEVRRARPRPRSRPQSASSRSSGGERPHRQQRDLREAPADLRRLGPGRHRQPRRPAGQRRRGAGVGAVAVAVGLDHRAELRALAQLGLAAARSCARRRRGRSGRPPAPSATVGDERGQRVGPGDQPGEAALAVDHRQVVVVLLGDLLRDRLGIVVVVDDDRVGGHQLGDFGRERLVRAASRSPSSSRRRRPRP